MSPGACDRAVLRRTLDQHGYLHYT